LALPRALIHPDRAHATANRFLLSGGPDMVEQRDARRSAPLEAGKQQAS